MEICGRHTSLKESGTFEFTSFTTFFLVCHVPKLSDSFSMVESTLADHGITYKLNLERFAKRRNRFVKNLKDLANLLGCFLFVNGNSVTAAGTSLVHVKAVRKIVERCFVENVNPAAVVRLLNMRKEEVNVEKKLQDLLI